LIRFAAAGIFTLLLIVLSTPDAIASCVTNKTNSNVWIEYYGTKVGSPNFKRGGQWIKPGQSKCLKGRSGDWLLVPLDWTYGKPSDWAARESRKIGGTQQNPRSWYTWVTIGTNDSAEVTGFVKFSDYSGWWVRPTANYRKGHTPSQGGSKFKDVLAQIVSGLAESLAAQDGDRLSASANQYNERGEYVAAEALYREAHKQYASQLGLNHWRTAVAASSLGAALTNQGRYEEAEPFLVDSFELLKRRLGIRDENTRLTLNRLIRLYDSAEAYDVAAEYRALLR
jgi:tetratricopeptide (TPR) repeat protein